MYFALGWHAILLCPYVGKGVQESKLLHIILCRNIGIWHDSFSIYLIGTTINQPYIPTHSAPVLHFIDILMGSS